MVWQYRREVKHFDHVCNVNFCSVYINIVHHVMINHYNPFLVYCHELDPGTVSLTCDRAQGDDSKHD